MLVLGAVDVLQTISSKLQNTYWDNVNRSSCHGGFNFTEGVRNVFSSVVCDCSFDNSTVCHVTHMYVLAILYAHYLHICCEKQ